MSQNTLVSLVLYTISIVLPSECVSQSYLGKTFYLAPMASHIAPRDLLPVQLKIVSNKAGNVRVIMPALEINATYLVSPKVTDISINGSGMKIDAIGIDNRGIQIISTVEVAIYVNRGDTFVGYGKVMSVIPVINSAKVFVVQSYGVDWGTLKSHFVIIATEESTNVSITLKTASPGNVTFSNLTFTNGDIINITLNRLQTFYVYLITNDLSGSLIESNKPIAVFSGTDCAFIPKNVGVCNIIESQMTPVSQWGKNYIVPNTYPGQCHVRIFAFYNASHISINAKFNLSSNITINSGDFWETTLYGSQAQPLVISSDTVVSVVLYGAWSEGSNKYNSNPFMLVVPEIRQYSTLSTPVPTLLYGDSVAKRRPFENYAAIILLQTSFNQLQYNGNTPEVLQTYSVLNEYTVVITQLNKNVTVHTFSVANLTTRIPMVLFIYGMARHKAYGFVAGYKFINTDCEDLVAPLHGSLSSYVVSHGNYVNVSCHQGYTLSGERTLVCTFGNLSANVGTCEANCEDLVAPLHGSLSSYVVSHGYNVNLSCDQGYTLSGERTLVCTSGNLSAKIGTCQANCKDLVPPIHGSLSSYVVSHGNNVNVSCHQGYTLSGERTLVCSSGNLSANIGICQANCKDLLAPLHGSLSSNVVSHGNYVNVSCDQGYTLSGVRTLVCTSGNLSTTIGTCQANCKDLVPPIHGLLSSYEVSHGKNVNVSCHQGYTLSGERTLVCSSGNLSAKIGTCQANCEDLVAPLHGSLSSYVVSHGNNLNVSCHQGYILSGERTLVCSSGNLSANIGTCLANPTKECSSPVTSIIVGAVLSLTIIVLLTVIIVMCIQKKCSQ